MNTNTIKDPGVAPLTSPTSGIRNINARDGDIHPGEIAVGVIIGRASEYFDFFVYAIASVLVFPALFFPFADRLEGTLYSFAVFALAFLARPVGTVVFMDIQRQYGPASARPGPPARSLPCCFRDQLLGLRPVTTVDGEAVRVAFP